MVAHADEGGKGPRNKKRMCDKGQNKQYENSFNH